MAISATVLTEGGSTADATSFTTASVTLVASRLYLLCTASATVDTTPLATITSTGATWSSNIASIRFQNIATPDVRLLVFRTMVNTNQTGAITIDFGATTIDACTWHLIEFTGTDTTGTSGSGAIVQTATNRSDSGTSLTVTLAAFGDATNNAAFGFFGTSSSEAIAVGTGFTSLGDQTQTYGGGASHTRTEWLLGEDTSVDASTASSRLWGGIAIEIAAPTASGGDVLIQGMQQLGRGMVTQTASRLGGVMEG